MKSRKRRISTENCRDRVNVSIPPPAAVLEEWMADTYSKLTTIDNDLTSVPINRELDSFRRFFELQAAVVRKREAEAAHALYAEQIDDLRKVTSKLDATRLAGKQVTNSVTEQGQVNPDNITRKEIRKMSKGISSIDKRLDSIKSQRKDLRREAGRLRSYLKITSGSGRKIRLIDVKERASTGGSLNANELSALLDSGSLTGITQETNKPEPSKSNSPRKGKTGKKGMRRLGVTERTEERETPPVAENEGKHFT